MTGTSEAGGTFRAFFDAHLPTVWRMLRCLGVPNADIDDVCQEVFIVAHRKLPEFEGRSSVSTWLYGISWRTWKDYRKRAYRRREQARQDIVLVTEPRAEQKLDTDRAMRGLSQILENLDEDKRTVFVLFEVEGLTMKEVASLLNIPLQTGFTRLRAARVLVRKAWSDRADA